MNYWLIGETVGLIVSGVMFVYYLIFKVAREHTNFSEEVMQQKIEELHDEVMATIQLHLAKKSMGVGMEDSSKQTKVQIQHKDELHSKRPALQQMKTDLINVLDTQNGFTFYYQTIFKYSSDYIQSLMHNNRMVMVFFYRRFIQRYHLIFAIRYEQGQDFCARWVQVTNYLFFLLTSLFVQIQIKRFYDDELARNLAYGVLYNLSVTTPVALFVLRFMNNFTSMQKKLKYYLINEKKKFALNKIKNRNNLWQFCFYVIFLAFSICIIQSIMFGKDISQSSHNNGNAIYAFLVVVAVDLALGRFIYCFLFLIIYFLLKADKNQMIYEAKEQLFYEHLLKKADAPPDNKEINKSTNSQGQDGKEINATPKSPLQEQSGNRQQQNADDKVKSK